MSTMNNGDRSNHPDDEAWTPRPETDDETWTSPSQSDDDRYVSIRTADDQTIIYDRWNPEAWLQSTAGIPLTDID
ncbi:hypothetical protein ACFQH6_07120 [Halobacteriaceae archaeon GCM10025711]